MQTLVFYFLIFLVSIFISSFVQAIPINKSGQIKMLQIENGNIFFNRKRMYMNLMFIPIFIGPILVSGLRYFVGTDYRQYYTLFLILKNADFAELLRQSNFNEILYVFLNRLASFLFNHNPNGIFFLSAICIFLFLYLSVIRMKFSYDLNIPLSIFVYYFYFFALTLNIQRQMIAVSIVLFAFVHLIDRKYISYIVYVIIASGFHTSAIFCLVFVCVPLIKKQFILNITLLVLPLFTNFILNFLFGISIFSKYFYRYSIEKGAVSVFTLLELVFFLMPLFLNKKKIDNLFPKMSVLYSISLSTIFLAFLASYQHWFSRTIYYITILQVITVPLIVKVQDTKLKKYIYLIFFVLYYIFYFILKFYIVGTEEIFPYRTIRVLFQ